MRETVAEPGFLHRRHRIAAAHDRHGSTTGRFRTRPGHRHRPRSERRHLEHTHRAVPHERPGVVHCGLEPLHGRGTDVDPDLVRAELLDRARCAGRRAVGRRGRDAVHGQHELDAAPRCVGEHLARHLDAVVLDERAPHRLSLRLEEREHHRAADEQPVDLPEQRGDHVDLAGDLGAAEDRDERPLRAIERLPQVLELLLHQEPGHRRLEQVRHALGRGVGAVRRAERVVHVHVAKPRQPLRELRIVALLLRVEAHVLEHQRLAVLERAGRRFRLLSDAVRSPRHRAAKQALEPLPHRAE